MASTSRSRNSSRSLCWICYKFASPNLKGVVRHMATVHAHDPNFFIRCGIQGCPRNYSNFFSFKKHLYRKHRDYLELCSPTNDDAPDLGNMNEDEMDGFLSMNVNHHEADTNSHKKQMALFLLKTKEIRKVSQIALDGIVDDVTSIIHLTVDKLKCEVDNTLKSSGINGGISTFSSLGDVFNNTDIRDPFNGLSSKYLQDKFYKDHFNLLVSSVTCIFIKLYTLDRNLLR